MANIKDGYVHSKPASDGLTDLIYTRLLKVTREKIEEFDLENVDVLLLAIVALCVYDLRLNRYDALRSHYVGMGALVSKCGGIHNLGISLPFVQRMDRFLAVRLNQIPQFTSPELTNSNLLMRQPTDDLAYGSALRYGSSTISQGVVSLCSDAAQLLSFMDELNVTFEPSQLPDVLNPKLEYFYFLRENIDARHAVLNHQHNLAASSFNKDLMVLTAAKLVTYYAASANYLPIVTDLLATRLWNLLTKAALASSRPPSRKPSPERNSSDTSSIPTIDLSNWADDMPMLLWLLFACALSDSGERNLSFAGHINSGLTSPDVSKLSSGTSRSSQSPTGSRTSLHSKIAIVSPSSPRRHRYLPKFLLQVAEHLIGERPLLGTTDWDEAVTDILEGFVWAGDRLSTEFESIVGLIHQTVIRREESDS